LGSFPFGPGLGEWGDSRGAAFLVAERAGITTASVARIERNEIEPRSRCGGSLGSPRRRDRQLEL
jgi:hypothetical protein